ncbi:MAG: hypothetical protein ACNA8S_12520 [Deferrisomatales bacterium]
MKGLRTALAVLLILALAGCGRDLRFTVTFEDARGLRPGDDVVWGENPIGRVRDVRYIPAGAFEVKAVVEERFRTAVTDQGRFLVSDRPDGPGRRLELVSLGKGGGPLESGAVVRGSTPAELFGELMGHQVRDFFDRLRQLPESEGVRELSREVERLAEEMARVGREARETLQRDVLPELERELEELKRRLRELGRQEEAEPIEIRLRELRRA